MHALLLISKQRTKLEERISTWEILEDHATLPWRRESSSITTLLPLGSLSLYFCLFSNIKLIERNRSLLSDLVPLFQNESWCKSFHVKISLICMEMNLEDPF